MNDGRLGTGPKTANLADKGHIYRDTNFIVIANTMKIKEEEWIKKKNRGRKQWEYLVSCLKK